MIYCFNTNEHILYASQFEAMHAVLLLLQCHTNTCEFIL